MIAWRFFAAALSGLAFPLAAQVPNFNMQPGKWSYTTRTEIPGVGSFPVTFEQCVTQKDIDEGRSLAAQREAGVDCKYQDLKVSGNRYTFTAVCRIKDVPEPMITHYDMTASPTAFEAKMTSTGAHTKAMGGRMNMSMSARRVGPC
ncbi:MAG: DUF3617 domain-containing protein [Casimicrobiaceae bacterium]|nr:DUF3617 domain-containing protein [Casimicrobiaceae bacterium]